MSKRLILSACTLVLLSGSALAKPGLAASNVNLRAASNTTSEVLAKIPAGAPIDVGDCNDGWCAVIYQDKSGFAIATALDTSGRPHTVRRAPRPAGAPDGYVRVPPPAVVYAPGPYAYGPGPYWGPYWGPRWGYGWGWRRW